MGKAEWSVTVSDELNDAVMAYLAESGQGVEYEGGDVLLHELPLFSVRPTGDGQGEVPPRAVAQRQLHGDGHVIRQSGALFPHIAEPDAPSVPGLL